MFHRTGFFKTTAYFEFDKYRAGLAAASHWQAMPSMTGTAQWIGFYRLTWKSRHTRAEPHHRVSESDADAASVYFGEAIRAAKREGYAGEALLRSRQLPVHPSEW
ncbi:hypothetical protein [Acidicapsa acidisoli]|uniref:hypothetical protein n=1 Tax=Acidicapsa acidisoli TaxID=1615681 RepID=UPI0021DF9B19|nr:hypothetical protein [Acidicapsa acidisoli]